MIVATAPMIVAPKTLGRLARFGALAPQDRADGLSTSLSRTPRSMAVPSSVRIRCRRARLGVPRIFSSASGCSLLVGDGRVERFTHAANRLARGSTRAARAGHTASALTEAEPKRLFRALLVKRCRGRRRPGPGAPMSGKSSRPGWKLSSSRSHSRSWGDPNGN
jgi:hypothetical protein